MEYEAIIIGGGLAGLTSAAYLCKYGIKTLLVEKNEKTGGLVNTFWHQGFAFDGGIRAFENSGILFPMLNNLGVDMQFVRNPVSIGIQDQWIRLESRGSLRDYSAMLTSFFPDHAQEIAEIANEIQKVMGYMDVLYGLDNPLFLEDIRDPEYLVKTLLPWLLRYQVNIRKAGRLSEPIYSYLRRFTDQSALTDMIAQHFFQNTPTFFALSYFGLYLDYCYPLGGTGVLAQKVAEAIQHTGGEILTSTSVTQVCPNRHEVALSNGQTLRYQKLVWAADQKTLYTLTAGVNSPAVEKQRRLAAESVGGDSILTLFLGVALDRRYFSDRCGPHAFYTPSARGLSSLPDWREPAAIGPEALLDWVNGYLERTTYEISCPALRDPSLAPEGKTGVIVSTLMDYGVARVFSDAGLYDAFKQNCAKKISEVLEQSLFTGLREKTLFSLCATPLTLERETGNAQGAITGWAFTNPCMPAENRFRKIARSVQTPLNDIVQCGQWTFSPSGLPVSILTGKLAADRIRKTRKGRHA